MMCRKGASADVQSLDKHVEGMIHLKLQRPRKTEESFLTFRMGASHEEMANGALSLAPRPLAVSSNFSLRGCNNFRRNNMSENIANKRQTSRTDCEEPYLQIQLKSEGPEARMVLLFAKI